MSLQNNFEYIVNVFVILSIAVCTYSIQVLNENILAEEINDKKIILDYCNEFNTMVNYSIDDKNNFIFEFKNTPINDKVKELKISFKVDEIKIDSSLGQELNFENTLSLPIDSAYTVVQSPFSFDKGTFVGSNRLKFSSTLYVFFEDEICFNKIFDQQEINILTKTPTSFIDITETVIPEFYHYGYSGNEDWDEIYQIFLDASVKARSSYDEITKNAIFLQFFNWDKINNQWIEYVPNRVVSPVRIGLYGNFTDDEISAVAIFIEMMRDVAPNLEISFALESQDVTLYIHKGPCDNSFAILDDCDGYAGYYYSNFYDISLKPNHGSIWILETAHNIEDVLIHELGHAFGLNHNNCDESVVSSLNQVLGYKYETLQPLDMAILYSIYNNDFAYEQPNFLNLNTVEVLKDTPPLDFSYFKDHNIPWHACNFDYSIFENSLTKLDNVLEKLESLVNTDF